MSKAPLIATAVLTFVAVSACRPKVAASAVKDYSPGKTEYTGTVREGRIYIPVGSGDSGYGYGYSYGPGAQDAPTPDNYDSGTTGGTTAIRLTTATKTFDELVAELRAELAAPPKTATSGSTEPYGYESYSRADEIKMSILSQVMFVMNTLSIKDATLPMAAVTFTSLTVPEQERVAIPGAGADQNYIEVRYSLQFPFMVDSSLVIGKNGASGLVPKSSDYGFTMELRRTFDPCFKVPADSQLGLENMFYYFKPEACDFARLNADDAYFIRFPIELQARAAVAGGGQPDYDRVKGIWKDDKLVATFVFGAFKSSTIPGKVDRGTEAFNNFRARLKGLAGVQLVKEEEITETNVRMDFTVLSQGKPTARKVDVQLIHLDSIASIDPSLSKLVFGKRIGASDLFVYNGHAGYGNNVDHIQKMINPGEGQYVLFYLNGCSTYCYAKLDNPNFDVISNMKTAYFSQMADASFALLSGLVAGESYDKLLKSLPQDPEPVVSGERQSN